ncbi:glycoside hydrolase family 1 [Paenibacillus sp. FSL H8-0548]|uniref:glycoside hydrolase family 1 protein n=1 Tax=Paenibacillus sp. FSL H8-0548 TaxID=1920422 RepID=UPI00096BD53E|nr:family 1 glycosylhydrolase [Paenibacillus sp. FSL H8-0548]OMF26751.1 glycoside hydrolase family 1 [Paenibacillus sp. FSL H8-0548]
MSRQFSKSFYWGASTAAHQVEGNNVNSDFWLMENLEGTVFKEPSGEAVEHYRLYREDIALMAELGLNSYRFSMEWARIEPEEGRFDQEVLDHYRDVLTACEEFNIMPIITLHHFTSPQWLIRAGGWESMETPAKFARYCEHVMRELGDSIPYVCTINEANISIGITKIIKRHQTQNAAQVGINTGRMESMQKYYVELGQAFGVPPQDVHAFLAARSEKGLEVIFKAHTEAREAIRKVSPQTQVGITLSLYDIQSIPGGEEHAAHAMQEEFLQFLPYLEEDDFFGLQNYTRYVYGPEGYIPPAEDAEKTQMGNEYYPEGLESVIRYASKYLNKPIIITENGIGTENDERRIAFIDRALQGVHDCVIDGIPVLGYMHWSLLDNFEWQLGYSKTFGLISVDRSTQERKPKPSAYHYGNIAKNNLL